MHYPQPELMKFSSENRVLTPVSAMSHFPGFDRVNTMISPAAVGAV